MLLLKPNPTPMKIISNRVLIKPDDNYDEVTLNDGTYEGLKLKLVTKFEEFVHAISSGKVLEVPDKLVFYPKGGEGSVRFDVDMELQKGDHIIFHYLAVKNAEKHSPKIPQECGYPHGALFIDYDLIYVVIRGEQVFTVNGYIIIEAEEDEINTKLYLPKHMRTSKSQSRGTVRYIGNPARAYQDYPEIGIENEYLKPGDKVWFPTFDAVPLQTDLHTLLDNGKVLYRMQYKDVVPMKSLNKMVRSSLKEVEA